MLEYGRRPEHAERIINTSKGMRKLFISPYGVNGATLIMSGPTFLDIGDESWNYMDWRVALKALNDWNPDKQSEPDGWVRNVRTGRYRPGGHACQEYVRWQGSPEEQAKHAVSVTCPGHTFIFWEDTSFAVELPFPPQTTCYSTLLRPQDCTCGYCFVACSVFQYLDRCVVIFLQEMMTDTVTIEQAVKRLMHGLNGEAL